MTQPMDPNTLAQFQAFLAAQQQTTQPSASSLPVQPVSVTDAINSANRPKGYGPSLWSKANKLPGTRIPFTVAGPTAARQAISFTTKQPETFADGNPKPELVIPLDVPVSAQHPEGRATLYSKGSLTTKLSQAMAVAGVPGDLIKQGLEVGATGSITFNGLVTKQGRQASYTENDFTVVYARPGQAPTPAPVAQAAPPVVTPAIQAPTAGPGGALTPEQAELLARLTDTRPAV